VFAVITQRGTVIAVNDSVMHIIGYFLHFLVIRYYNLAFSHETIAGRSRPREIHMGMR